LLGGEGDRGHLAELIDRERRQADALTEAAEALLAEAGAAASAATLERVRETLHAAALDEDVAARVRAGTLARDERSLGVGTLRAGAGAVDGAEEDAPTADERLQAARAAQRQATAAVRQAAAGVRDAELGAERALRALEAARRRLADAEAERDEAAAALGRL